MTLTRFYQLCLSVLMVAMLSIGSLTYYEGQTVPNGICPGTPSDTCPG